MNDTTTVRGYVIALPFSRGNGLSFPSPEDLPDPGIKHRSPA